MNNIYIHGYTTTSNNLQPGPSLGYKQTMRCFRVAQHLKGIYAANCYIKFPKNTAIFFALERKMSYDRPAYNITYNYQHTA